MQEQGRETSIIQRIASAYGLAVTQIDPPQKGYRNSSYRLTLANGELRNLIIYKHEPGMLDRITRADTVAAQASTAGLPTRQRRGNILQLVSPSRTRYAALYNYLPGTTIPWEAYTQKHLKLLGKTIAELHTALETFPAESELPSVNDEYRTICKRMQRYFANAHVKQAMKQKLGLQINLAKYKTYQKALDLSDALPGQQALHMDFVRGNILFEGEGASLKISGILDFEKTGYGHPLLDLARTYSFLLVDCKYKSADKVKKYFLQSGYIKCGNQVLDRNSWPLFKTLMQLYLAYDFYKFLRHNPYEFLHQNEHYIRTKDILITDKLLIE